MNQQIMQTGTLKRKNQVKPRDSNNANDMVETRN